METSSDILCRRKRTSAPSRDTGDSVHILDLFPRERFEQQGIRRFEIAYKAEAYMGDRLSFYEQAIDDNETDIEVRKNEGDVVCQAKVCFK